jgi:hypothetical protein
VSVYVLSGAAKSVVQLKFCDISHDDDGRVSRAIGFLQRCVLSIDRTVLCVLCKKLAGRRNLRF